MPVRRYDDAIAAAINIGAHVDRASTAELIKRLPTLPRKGAVTAKARLL